MKLRHSQGLRVGMLLASGAWLTLAATPGYGQAAPDRDAAAPQGEEGARAADTGIQDIIITARRTEENLQKVPIAVTALTEAALREKGTVNLTDVQFSAPSVQMTTAYGRLSGGFSIRGLSGGVQTYFAEVAGGPTEAGAPFYDIANVQVLNGPQGTLFGRANTAGAVLVTPAKPEFNRLIAELDYQRGSYNLNRMTGIANLPIIEDQLALRVAVNQYHRDGDTRAIGSNQRLNEDNSWGLRASLLWRPGGGRFTNYAVVDWFDVDQAPGGFVLSAINTNLPLYNLPGGISAPGGLAAGTATFGAVCNTAVAAGLSPSVNACIDQRLRIAATFKPALIAELARAGAGGDAVRSVPHDPNLRLDEVLRRITFVDQAEFDFGHVGPTTLTLRNIFGYQAVTGVTAWDVDGLGGLVQSAVAVATTAAYATTPSGQQFGNTAIYRPGPYQKTYTNETQLRGTIGDKALDWNIGYYYQNTPSIRNLDGIRNLSRVYSGITLPTLGYNPSFPFADGGYTRQQAVFGQATLDFGAFASSLSSIHLTGGLRKSWDKSSLTTAAVSTSLPSGAYVPGATSTATTESSGTNYTVSLDWQATSDLLLYAAHRKGYRPGGINQVLNATGLPNYSPTYAPETVKDIELGIKYGFRVGGVSGRLNAAAYNVDYSNIQRLFSAAVNGVTTTYNVNASAARIRGFELQAQIKAGGLSIDGSYAYSDPKFTSWLGADPLGLIKPGNAACLPGSTAALCLLNLADTPFPNISRHQASLTTRYAVPVGATGESEVALSATGYYQSRRYFSDAATRNIQVYGEGVRDAISQAPFGRLNLRLEWNNVADSRLSLAAFVNNVTNKDYALTAVTQLHSLGTAVKLYGEPRIFGLEARFRFER
ncbi:MAG: TonB-dependent receptor [Sphingomonas bacterium]